MVDPGSTDGSKEIAESYGDRIVRMFQPDSGPADGLNRGFQRATGEIFGFLNSDDVLLPGALSAVLNTFGRTNTDVLHGHAYMIDGDGVRQRKLYSDKFSLDAYAYGSCVLMQPSSFMRRSAFEASGGFNVNNKSNWDGELFVDMGMAGCMFCLVDEFLSCYRVYGESITGSGRFADLHKIHNIKMFEKITGTPYERRSILADKYFRYRRKLLNYRDSVERITKGPVFSSKR